MNTINAYPLTWPSQFPRTKIRDKGKFSSTLSSALKNVKKSIELFAKDSGKKLEGLIISSNVTLGVKPDDTGVSVWFTWDNMKVCIPVDRYSSVESNLQAIHHIIEARRVELRHGTLALVRATFQGFKSLPPPVSKKLWWQVLNVDEHALPIEIKASFRKLASKYHPDKFNGSDSKMSEINLAFQESGQDQL